MDHASKRARAHEARTAVIKEHVRDGKPLHEHIEDDDDAPSLFDGVPVSEHAAHVAEPEPVPEVLPPAEQVASQAQAQRELGIARATLGADPEWLVAAWEFLVEYLHTHDEMFVDDLWAAGLPHTHEDRALGALFRRASRSGYMTKTGTYRPSARSNMTEKPVWRSLINQED